MKLKQVSDGYWQEVAGWPSLCVDEAIILSLGLLPSKMFRRHFETISEDILPEDRSPRVAIESRHLELAMRLKNLIEASKHECLVDFDVEDQENMLRPSLDLNCITLLDRFELCKRWACLDSDGALTTYVDRSLTKIGIESSDGAYFARCRVLLPEFVNFCIRRNWRIPEGMRKYGIVATERDSNDQGRWPWGRHETELLRHLEAAARRFWVNFDPTDRTTSCSNGDVVEFLRERGVAERVAQIMAQILRADRLPPGPIPGSTKDS